MVNVIFMMDYNIGFSSAENCFLLMYIILVIHALRI